MNKLLVLVACMLAISIISVYADVTEEVEKVTSASGDFSVQMLDSQNKIPLGGKAVIQLLIKNNENVSRRYRLGFDNTGEWLSIGTEPVYHALTGIEVNSESDEITTIEIKAREETGYGTYFLKTTISNENTMESIVILIPVGIRTTEELQGVRLPDLRVSMDVPTKVDPRGDNVITVYLLNKNNRDIQELTIQLESKLMGNKSVKTSLAPNEEKEVKVDMELDSLIPPQQDTIKGKVLVAGYTFTPTAKTYDIVGYNTNLNVQEKTEKGFFKTTKIIAIENQGNDEISDTIRSKKGFISGIFTKTEPESRIVEIADENYYSWYVNLKPTIKSEIRITTNYQPVFWFIVILIAALIVQYTVKSKVRITKKSASAEISEGGLSNIKILLTIKNDTNRLIKDIEVKDTIPQIVDIVKDFPVGTVKPDKILMHKTKGVIVKFNIDELDASEERIIKYDIKSKLSIIGSLTLPPATVKYKTSSGRERVVKSKRLVVGEEEK